MNLEEIRAIWAANNPEGRNSGWAFSGFDYGTFNMFREVLENDTPVSSKWLGWDEWRNKEPRSKKNPYGQLPPNLDKDGTTYEGCVDWEFDIEMGQLHIVVWDGEMLHGDRTKKRAEWTYQIRDEHTKIIELLEQLLRESIWRRATRQHQDWVGEQTKRRIQKRFDIMMKVPA